MARKKILLTGASGFLGKEVLKRFTQETLVYYIIRPGSSLEISSEWAAEIIPIEMDLSENIDLAELPRKIDSLIHLAQSSAFRNFPDDWQDIFAVNVQSTNILLDYARQAQANSFVFASTGSVYSGLIKGETETDRVCPKDYYGASKFAAETLCEPYRKYFAISCLRFFFLYGPGQKHRLVSSLTDRILKNEKIIIQGDDQGSRLRLTYVEDASRVVLRAALNAWDGIFNVANHEETSIAKISSDIGEMIGVKPIFKYLPDEFYNNYVCETAKLETNLDLSLMRKNKDGLRVFLKAL